MLVIILWIILIVYLVNTIAAILTVLFRRKSTVASTWAWLLCLVLVPVIGFLFYMYLGRGLNLERLNKINENEYKEITSTIMNDERVDDFIVQDFSSFGNVDADNVKFFKSIESVSLTKGNQLELFINGPDLFKSMFEDIKQAKNSVHVEFFAIKDDELGNSLRDLLIEKAKEGVEVRVLYDQVGSKVKKRFYEPLFAAGGKASRFLTSKGEVRNFRANYRNHRKIVVIDGLIGYIGGYNVGDQYVDKCSKFHHWRDTHTRIVGPSVLELQLRFVKDWNTSTSDGVKLSEQYFPIQKTQNAGDSLVQIISSSPSITDEVVKLSYIKLINSAQKRVWIQTPYLIPDESVMEALKLAAFTGVDVRIMIPCMPDHIFVYRATEYYANELHSYGIKIYIYNNGFLHSKAVMVDDNWISIGSANQDIRSYSLNFESNAFIYDSKIVDKYAQIYLNDITKSTLLTDEIINNQSHYLKFKQHISRLLSPIL